MADSLTSFIIAIRGVLPSEDAKAAIVAQTGRGFQVKMENNGSRAIISPEYNAKDFSRAFAHEANGIVIDTSTARVLAIPIKRYNPKPDAELFAYDAARMEKYTIEKVQDGTVLTLYYYKDEWQISSTGGFCMNNMKWIGELTYMDMLMDISPDLFDKLDKRFSYTIGMHHPAIHPLARDPRRIWLYWACDIEAANEESPRLVFTRPDIGLDFPQRVNLTVAEMIESNRTALQRYLAGEQPEYGYILRGDFAEFKQNSNIFLESSLAANLKQLFYNITKKFSDHRRITADNRIKYICVIAYFYDRSRSIFLQLFPQFQTYFDQITNILNAICRQVLLAAGNKKTRQALTRVAGGGGRNAIIKIAANIVLTDLEGREGKAVFQVGAPGAKGVIWDHIMRGVSVNYWCNALVGIIE